jgi:hypothetical protein
MPTMSNRERTELISLCKQRAKLAKQMAAYRAADLLAGFEAQLASEYSWDGEETWAEAHGIVDEAVADANARILDRCRELGIPPRFSPSIEHYWRNRGENASRERRAELRKVAASRIDAMTKGAQVQIDRAALEVQTYLVGEGLETEAAREFLESGLPTVETLMPALAVPEIERMLGPGAGPAEGPF